MKLGLELAEKGRGKTSPNPMVGAVIVMSGEIIGQGYHEKYGELHAELNAINSCSQSIEGSTMYVTLEPCCHFGKTPPCTEAIIAAGIGTVVVGSIDPNPLVTGKGIKRLKENGIHVITGVLEQQCNELNKFFLYYMKTHTPYVAMKYAMTSDGKIATFSGKSKWITGQKARDHVHSLRNIYSGIMVGVDTIIADNPELTCRNGLGMNPKRIICDTNLRIPLTSKVVQTTYEADTYIATCSEDYEKLGILEDLGCKIIKIPKRGNHIDLNILTTRLADEKIDSVLLEGGATLNASALESSIVNKVYTYIAPSIFGGKEAKTPVGGRGVEEPQQAFKLTNRKITILGEDVLMEYEVK